MTPERPNIEMLLRGAVSGQYAEWSALRTEVKQLLEDLDRLHASQAKLQVAFEVEENDRIAAEKDAAFQRGRRITAEHELGILTDRHVSPKEKK